MKVQNVLGGDVVVCTCDADIRVGIVDGLGPCTSVCGYVTRILNCSRNRPCCGWHLFRGI